MQISSQISNAGQSRETRFSINDPLCCVFGQALLMVLLCLQKCPLSSATRYAGVANNNRHWLNLVSTRFLSQACFWVLYHELSFGTVVSCKLKCHSRFTLNLLLKLLSQTLTYYVLSNGVLTLKFHPGCLELNKLQLGSNCWNTLNEHILTRRRSKGQKPRFQFEWMSLKLRTTSNLRPIVGARDLIIMNVA